MRAWEPPTEAETRDMISRKMHPSLHAEALLSICENCVMHALEICADNATANPDSAEYWLGVAVQFSGGRA